MTGVGALHLVGGTGNFTLCVEGEAERYTLFVGGGQGASQCEQNQILHMPSLCVGVTWRLEDCFLSCRENSLWKVMAAKLKRFSSKFSD